MKTVAGVLTVAGLLAATACSSTTGHAATPSPTGCPSGQTSAGHTGPCASSTTPSKAPATPSVLPLRATQKSVSRNDDGHKIAATVQVLKLTMPAQSGEGSEPRKGHDYAGLTVKVCITADPHHEGVAISWSPWTLTYTDGTTAYPDVGAFPDSFSEPLYPNDMLTPVGQCRKGLVPFVVKSGHRPDFAEYTLPNTITQYRWRLTG